ncbi:MAG: FtsW/RodA/SpoVE family cell cycle protein [Helicobacter sp.]|uniref:FtsW/RodA/SpoVE family cell cycle protein n=1 Tax=Helicobacter sp. 10-6591 TaxID=2004998 RepID=UPI000DCC7AE4|nr:FtsW/RodA/SpoVE family cell cycle protein [Helicobacter sp. 10-6591]MCI6217787.1 FtsW/RodA/SpoVE family cell cycle protein [Helicobacter sp.]MCI7485762.1 FtsW/RodA/SpoVE family cell cycle protein [Helicobacter sp.]MDD7567766.1 FtsW/RodA/SpoVE family cell cycle protein [Helicobacter sp.]MDY5740896.1 FtsW/RodA/SpoVE family cell cycle protein [Helicobacter sp.]RAX54598.1 rod shape-determining protein RodA [Helicobacter sp. 10-6591]
MKILAHFDFIVVLLIVPLVLISLFLVNELDSALFIKQLKYIFLSLCVAVALFFIPYRRLNYSIIFLYIGLLLLVLAVKFIGVEKNNAKRWIEIPFTSFSIQPSEIMKIALMLFLASYISKKPPPECGYGWKDFGIISSFIILPFFFILLEPDLGTALLILLAGFGVLFLVGVNKKIWITLSIIGLLLAPTTYSIVFSSGLLKKYHERRINDFISGNYPYQVQQALIAIGSGGAYGKNKDMATQSQLNFLPYASTDFIFAYFVERFGLFGALGLLGLYFLLILYLLSICISSTQDLFLRVVSGYIAMLFFLYAGVNICMVLGFAPVVGVPLVLVSYGGTSFITFIALLTILESILAFRFVFEYNAHPTTKWKLFRWPFR